MFELTPLHFSSFRIAPSLFALYVQTRECVRQDPPFSPNVGIRNDYLVGPASFDDFVYSAIKIDGLPSSGA